MNATMNMNEAFEMMTKSATEGYSSLRTLAELNLSTWDKLVAKQMEMMTMCLDAGTKQYDSVKDVKRPDELVGKQVEMARECSEKLAEKNREMIELLTGTRAAYQGWAEASVQQLKDQLSQAGEAVRKTTRKAA